MFARCVFSDLEEKEEEGEINHTDQALLLQEDEASSSRTCTQTHACTQKNVRAIKLTDRNNTTQTRTCPSRAEQSRVEPSAHR